MGAEHPEGQYLEPRAKRPGYRSYRRSEFPRDGKYQTAMSSAPPDNQTVASQAAAGWRSLPPEYAIPHRAPSLQEAQQYCARLAHSHYENFSVVTWFLPKRLHQHFYNVYAYCRISDDLGDEVGNSEQALALLDVWEAELNATYLSLVEPPAADVQQDVEKLTAADSGRNPIGPRHPVFIALRETIRECDIPRQPFADLLTAFRQDQKVTRYPAFDDVLAIAIILPTPSGIWCSTCAATMTPSGRSFPITRAPRCNSQISGRT